jgi:thiol-disulfide isomerase/thioredoxin
MSSDVRVYAAAVVLGVGGWMVSDSSPSGAPRSAEQILKELDNIKIPSYDASKKNDVAYVSQFLTKLREATEKRASLILELYKADPDHDRIPMLMAERWSVRPFGLAADKLQSEIGDVLAHCRNQKLKVEATFARAYGRLYDSGRDEPLDLSPAEECLKLAPKDARGATLLQLAASRTRDSKLKTAVEDRILREFPETSHAQRIQGRRSRRQGDRIGKPFDLEFKDAISGSIVSVKKLKGKLVVIDFWATWCGPCVAEMPEMKQLYAKYHGHGVEFIGVSLDRPEREGGLDSLKKFVKDNGIAWPQYFQGDGWDSAFSCSCGINAIPAAFVIDTEGKLYSTEARGKLDAMIPELLNKAAGTGAGAEPRGDLERNVPALDAVSLPKK